MVLEHNSRATSTMTHGGSNGGRGELDGNAFADASNFANLQQVVARRTLSRLYQSHMMVCLRWPWFDFWLEDRR